MHTLKPPIEKHQKAQERDCVISQGQKQNPYPTRNLSQDHPGTSGANRELMPMKEKASLWKLMTSGSTSYRYQKGIYALIHESRNSIPFPPIAAPMKKAITP